MPVAAPIRPDDLFAELLVVIVTAPREELPALLGQLRQVEAEALLRLQSAPQSNSHPPNPERLLTVEECAARLGCSKEWLYRHARQLPFTRPQGYGLRFLESELTSYLRRK